ncbi:unnamed protein product [Owenia fusiformis]|uniref:Uncharacterized protein n=1 Tax=Owenia fusiformis TaxID=6347 RepID=A0A8J1XVB1_OWEFU|nr:unnamed protein product [Owenia fusiformis]
MESINTKMTDRQQHMNNTEKDTKKLKSKNKTKKELAEDFASNTSAHGFAHLVTSKYGVLHVLWVICIIASGTGMLYGIFSSFVIYLNFPTNEIVSKYTTKQDFPAVTLCNVSPVSAYKAKLKNRVNLQSFIEYAQFLMKYDTLKTIPGFEEFEERFKSSESIMTNVNFGYWSLQSHNWTDIILSCKINSKPCPRDNDFFKHIMNPSFGICVTINGNQSAEKIKISTSGPTRGLSMLVFLDTYREGVDNVMYDTESVIQGGSGLYVQVHPPEIQPDPVTKGVQIMPGQSTSIRIKTHVNKYLTYPHGNCTKPFFIDDIGYAHSETLCMGICKQALTREKCGCTSLGEPHDSKPYTLGLKMTGNLSYCGRFDIENALSPHPNITELDQLFETLRCQQNINLNFYSENDKKSCACFPPCMDTTYEITTSASAWPEEMYMKAIYDHYINNRPDRDDLTAYNSMKHLNISSEVWKRHMKKNILRLNIYFKDLEIILTEQDESFTFTEMLSSIGGFFGFYMGISVLTAGRPNQNMTSRLSLRAGD